MVCLAFVAFVAAGGVLPGAETGSDGAVAGHVHDLEAGHGLGRVAYAQSCWPNGIPLGALPEQPQPIWCYNPPEGGPATFVSGPNSWLDGFDHHLSLADLGPGYRVFEQPQEHQMLLWGQHWRHADHWMVDVKARDAPGEQSAFGGVAMRPDRSFRFVDGRLVVEADAAVGIEGYDGAWPELVVTTAPAPTQFIDSLYALGQFKGHWTLGCRLNPDRSTICALYDDTDNSHASRRFEVASHVSEGAQIYGGNPYPLGSDRDRAFRVCLGTDPDTNCRDRFRLELTRTGLVVYVNGVRYFEASDLPPDKQLGALLGADVYVYFASWIYRPNADTVRFHWGHLAVNPDTPPTAAPGFDGHPDDETNADPVHHAGLHPAT
jgi:hypothetical protein